MSDSCPCCCQYFLRSCPVTWRRYTMQPKSSKVRKLLMHFLLGRKIVGSHSTYFKEWWFPHCCNKWQNTELVSPKIHETCRRVLASLAVSFKNQEWEEWSVAWCFGCAVVRLWSHGLPGASNACWESLHQNLWNIPVNHVNDRWSLHPEKT